MKNQLPLLFLSFLMFTSCKREEINPSSKDYLVFGQFYGKCVGERCIEIFKLENGQLSEDSKDMYPSFSESYEGNFSKLSQAQFNEAKDLIDNFPRDLWKESDKVIGQPDAGDWGGLYIEFKHKGKRKFWLLDKMKSNVPAKYHKFMDEVIQAIDNIQ